MFNRLIAWLFRRAPARRPAPRPRRQDDTPPPTQVVVFPRRGPREAVCPDCEQAMTEGVTHVCWGKWRGME